MPAVCEEGYPRRWAWKWRQRASLAMFCALALGGCASPPRPSVFSNDPAVKRTPASSRETSATEADDASAPDSRAALPTSSHARAGNAKAALAAARSYLGVPYRYGGESSEGVDCSGLVMEVYASCEISLPRSCAAQYGRGKAVARTQLAPGDLVFFGEKGSLPSHVGIYEGNGYFIHSSSGHQMVRRDSLEHRWFREHYLGARRLLPSP